MSREKVNLGHRVWHFFTYHPWLKVIALVLAVIVWFYVKDEMARFNY